MAPRPCGNATRQGNQPTNGRSSFEKLSDFGYRASSNWRQLLVETSADNVRACQDHPCSSWMNTCEVLVRHGANTNRIHDKSTESFKRCSDRGFSRLGYYNICSGKAFLTATLKDLMNSSTPHYLAVGVPNLVQMRTRTTRITTTTLPTIIRPRSRCISS